MISWVFAFPSFPLALLILLVAMVAVVVAAAALEIRTPPRHRGAGSRTPIGSRPLFSDELDLPVETVEAVEAVETVVPALREQPPHRPDDAAPEQPTAPPSVASGVIVASAPVLVLRLSGSDGAAPLELGPIGIDTEVAGVLFAGYVVSGAPERSRVTGWVTAAGDPPSLDTVGSGERLRGKPAKVRGLLDCRDEDRNWVTLDGRTDIALAVDRRAPRDEVLTGLLHWWRLATSATPGVAPGDVGSMRRGMTSVESALGDNPLAYKVREVAHLCASAEAAGVGVEVNMVSAGSLRSNDSGTRSAEGGARLASAG